MKVKEKVYENVKVKVNVFATPNFVEGRSSHTTHSWHISHNPHNLKTDVAPIQLVPKSVHTQDNRKHFWL